MCRSRGFYRDGVYKTDEVTDNDGTSVPTDVLPSDATVVTPGESTDPSPSAGVVCDEYEKWKIKQFQFCNK